MSQCFKLTEGLIFWLDSILSEYPFKQLEFLTD